MHSPCHVHSYTYICINLRALLVTATNTALRIQYRTYKLVTLTLGSTIINTTTTMVPPTAYQVTPPTTH